MALNSFITEDGGEMGRAQVVQAEAAGKIPDVRMNPILLKPTSDQKAQVILMGNAEHNLDAADYHEKKAELRSLVQSAYDSLAAENDIIVIEGAGSPAEINLRENDLVNMGMAEIADAPVLLVGDIDKGGVFASLYGTVMLLSEEERKRVKGMIINKFRGDVALLEPGLRQIEALTGIPVLGVVPYTELKIEDEDSLSERFKNKAVSYGKVNVEVLYLPHVSNFTDFDVFAMQEDVNLRYVMRGESIGDPDILIIPGTKTTMNDLQFLRESGLADQIYELYRKGRMIIGLCGGFQILGKTIKDPHHAESTIDEMPGLGLLDVDTIFETNKTTTQVLGRVSGMHGAFEDLNSMELKGYEIHMGYSFRRLGAPHIIDIYNRFGLDTEVADGAVDETGRVIGTYVHGLFDNLLFTRKLINIIRAEKGLDQLKEPLESYETFKEKEYDKLADLLRSCLDMEKLYEIVGR
jgi:adenosylcobyric acid synthase